MTGFDGELHLRLRGEQALADRRENRDHGDPNPVAEQARALVAVGAVPAETAQQVVEDYDRARDLRGLGGRRWGGGRQRGVRPPAPQRRRMVVCEQTLDQPWGQLQLRYVSLSDRGLSIAVTARANSAGPARAVNARTGPPRSQPGLHAAGPGPLTATDDAGTSVGLNFSGGGSDLEWTGTYRATDPLAFDTTWIEIGGLRVDLTTPTPAVAVELESLDAIDPVRRHLDRCLEQLGNRHGPAGGVDEAVEALIACGALPPDSGLVEDVRAVGSALRGSHHAPSAAANLPPRWQALLAGRGRSGGPIGLLPLAVQIADLDGVSIGLTALESTDDGFEVGLETVGAAPPRRLASASVDEVALTYTATDDLGGHYLGHLGSWSASDFDASGELQFWPALDPNARQLDIAVTGARTRAVVHLPLDWDGAS